MLWFSGTGQGIGVVSARMPKVKGAPASKIRKATLGKPYLWLFDHTGETHNHEA